MSRRQAPKDLPLKPAVLHILLALTKGDLHGLGIADEAAAASGGVVKLGPGTLYRSLDEMRALDLVESVPSKAGNDPRRKYYRITGNGRQLLQAEMERLARLVRYARDQKLLPGSA